MLAPQDWKAEWIGVPAEATVRKTVAYHAAETTLENDVKWVQVDLGAPTPIASVRLIPMRHDGRDGFGFPLRFKVEASASPDFAAPTVLADRTAADFPGPGVTPVSIPGRGTTARYVRAPP